MGCFSYFTINSSLFSGCCLVSTTRMLLDEVSSLLEVFLASTGITGLVVVLCTKMSPICSLVCFGGDFV